MRILYFLNLSTNPDHLESDSGFQVMRQLVQAVNKVRDDVHWYLVCPKETKKFLHGERITILPYEFTNWAVQNRFHFDFIKFRKVFKSDYDVDLIFSSQPELNGNLYSLFNLPGRDMRFSVPIVSYLHWLAVKETPKYQESCFIRQVEGMIYSKFVGINSKWAKKIFMKQLASLIDVHPMINKKAYDMIDKKLQPLFLGTPLEEIDKYKDLKYDEFDVSSSERKILKKVFETVESKKTIVFNHRLMVYTGAELFLKFMNRLGKERDDFVVWLTDPNYKAFFKNSKLDLLSNMLRVVGLPWKAYIALLSRVSFGCACHFQYSAWSLSCIDTMSVSKPIIVPKAFAFPEIVGEDYPMFYANDEKTREVVFLHRANYLLDNEDEAKKVGAQNRKRVEELFDWKVRVDDYLKVFDSCVNYDYGEETDAMRKLVRVVRKGALDKKAIFNGMGWSRSFDTKVTWQRYRNFLLKNGFVEDILNPKVVFMPKHGGQTLLHTKEPKVELKLEKDVEEIEVEI